MDPDKRKRLEAAGWEFGDAADFLELTDAERRLVALRSQLGAAVRRLRTAKGITQKQAAVMLKTSQARVVDIEASLGSLDNMICAYYVLGGELSRLETLGAPLTEAERKERVTPGKKIVARVRVATRSPEKKRKAIR